MRRDETHVTDSKSAINEGLQLARDGFEERSAAEHATTARSASGPEGSQALWQPSNRLEVSASRAAPKNTSVGNRGSTKPRWDIDVVEGTPVDAQAAHHIDEYTRGATWRLLGSGWSDLNSVFRVTPASGAPYQLKQYGSPLARDADMRRFAFLRELVRDRRDLKVDVAEPIAVGERSMRLRDVRGKNLESVLVDGDLPLRDERILVNQFNRFSRAVADALWRDHPGRFESELRRWDVGEAGKVESLNIAPPLSEGQRPGQIRLKIKANQVLVEAVTGRLKLIDPY